MKNLKEELENYAVIAGNLEIRREYFKGLIRKEFRKEVLPQLQSRLPSDYRLEDVVNVSYSDSKFRVGLKLSYDSSFCDENPVPNKNLIDSLSPFLKGISSRYGLYSVTVEEDNS